MSWHELFQNIDNNISVPVFGVSLTSLGMALGGAFASFAYGEPEHSRLKLFSLVIANSFIATVAVAIVPVWLKWEWVTPLLQPPLAGGVAFAARWAIPLAVELAPAWLRSKFGASKAIKTGDEP